MTLGRLMELYQAEQQGKQIMMRTWMITCPIGSYCSNISVKKVKISDYELSALISPLEGNSVYYSFFIENEEDEHGHKINKPE